LIAGAAGAIYEAPPEAPQAGEARDIGTQGSNASKAYIVLCSILLLVAIVVLEIIGAAKASQGRKAISKKEVAWCSPIFQPFGLAIQSGCTFHVATQDPTKGIGCVNLPAALQSDWLRATSILIPVALVLQLVDFCILTLVHGSLRWRAV